jgi:HSP20 family protein
MAEAIEKGNGGAVTRWDPFREIDELRDRLWRSVAPLQERLAGVLWSPAADVEETDTAFVIEAELPGVTRENVSVEVSEGEIAIHGKIDEKEHEGVLHRRARRTGSFEYRLSVSQAVDAEKVEAKLENGVLTVTAPKKEPAARRKVEVKVAGA